MSFSATLKEAVQRVDGAIMAIIIGIDGMPVEEYAVEKALNMDDLSAESSQMMKEVVNAAKNLGIGEAREFSVMSDYYGLIMRRINEEYFFALILKTGGNVGKGRFILRSLIPRIENDF